MDHTVGNPEARVHCPNFNRDRNDYCQSLKAITSAMKPDFTVFSYCLIGTMIGKEAAKG